MKEYATENKGQRADDSKDRCISECHVHRDSSMVAPSVYSGRHVLFAEEAINPVIENYGVGFGTPVKTVPDKSQHSHNKKECDESEEARWECGRAMGESRRGRQAQKDYIVKE